MKNNFKKFIFLIVLFIGLSFSPKVLALELENYHPQVTEIFGSEIKIEGTSISKAIAAVYKYGVSIGIILSVIMIMFGGFNWLIAGGAPDKINNAKGYIGGALIGLVILLYSYFLLASINPALVEIKDLGIKSVETIPKGNQYECMGEKEKQDSTAFCLLKYDSMNPENKTNPKYMCCEIGDDGQTCYCQKAVLKGQKIEEEKKKEEEKKQPKCSTGTQQADSDTWCTSDSLNHLNCQYEVSEGEKICCCKPACPKGEKEADSNTWCFQGLPDYNSKCDFKQSEGQNICCCTE